MPGIERFRSVVQEQSFEHRQVFEVCQPLVGHKRVVQIDEKN